MHELAGKHIVLGLSAGVACYKAAELCRLLVTEGASVQVVMTEAARQFITPLTMHTPSVPPVYRPPPARRVPLLLARAMNREMWAPPAPRRNLARVVQDGAVVLGVGSGEQACGETGAGRMLEPQELLDELLA